MKKIGIFCICFLFMNVLFAGGLSVEKIISNHSKTYTGIITYRSSKWPVEITFTSINRREGRFEGRLFWKSYQAITKIKGTYNGRKMKFKEVAYIKKGAVALRTVYTFTYNGGKFLEGNWVYPGQYGKIRIDVGYAPKTNFPPTNESNSLAIIYEMKRELRSLRSVLKKIGEELAKGNYNGGPLYYIKKDLQAAENLLKRKKDRFPNWDFSPYERRLRHYWAFHKRVSVIGSDLTSLQHELHSLKKEMSKNNWHENHKLKVIKRRLRHAKGYYDNIRRKDPAWNISAYAKELRGYQALYDRLMGHQQKIKNPHKIPHKPCVQEPENICGNAKMKEELRGLRSALKKIAKELAKENWGNLYYLKKDLQAADSLLQRKKSYFPTWNFSSYERLMQHYWARFRRMNAINNDMRSLQYELSRLKKKMNQNDWKEAQNLKVIKRRILDIKDYCNNIRRKDPTWDISIYENEFRGFKAQYDSFVNHQQITTHNFRQLSNYFTQQKKLLDGLTPGRYYFYRNGDIGKSYYDLVQQIKPIQIRQKIREAASLPITGWNLKILRRQMQETEKKLNSYPQYANHFLRKKINGLIESAYTYKDKNVAKAVLYAKNALYFCDAALLMVKSRRLQNLREDAKAALEQMRKLRNTTIYTSSFHQKNTNKILLSSSNFNVGKNTNSKTDFVAGDYIYARIYLPARVKNIYGYKMFIRLYADDNAILAIRPLISKADRQRTYLDINLVPAKYTPSSICLHVVDRLIKLSPRRHYMKLAVSKDATGRKAITTEFTLNCRRGMSKLKDIQKDLRYQKTAAIYLPISEIADNNLERDFMNLINKRGFLGDPLRVVITRSTWLIHRNEFTGIVLFRSLTAAVAVKRKNGKCRYYHFAIKQDYDGQKFGRSQYYMLGKYYDILEANVYTNNPRLASPRVRKRMPEVRVPKVSSAKMNKIKRLFGKIRRMNTTDWKNWKIDLSSRSGSLNSVFSDLRTWDISLPQGRARLKTYDWKDWSISFPNGQRARLRTRSEDFCQWRLSVSGTYLEIKTVWSKDWRSWRISSSRHGYMSLKSTWGRGKVWSIDDNMPYVPPHVKACAVFACIIPYIKNSKK